MVDTAETQSKKKINPNRRVCRQPAFILSTKPNRLNVLTLIADLKAGSQTAFRHLVEQYQHRVYNTVLTIVRDPVEAEDVAQEVFVQVFESIGRFGGELNLTAWIYRIATTKALEAYRKRHARKRFAWLVRLTGSGEGLQDQALVEFVHPGVQLEEQERGQVLFAAIDRLPDRQKVAFTLHYLEGLTHAEIMAVMQTSTGSVESLLHRAKQKLQQQLTAYYQQDQ